MSNSSDRLVLNTKKSLYKPVEIEIDGKVYQNIKTTHAVLKEVNRLDDEIKDDSDFEPVCNIIKFLFNVDMETLEKLDKREVQDIYTFMKQKFQEIEKERRDLVIKTFANIWGTERKEEKAPNPKRSGNKQ